MLNYRIDLQPVLESAIRELKDTTDAEIESILKSIANDAPDEIKSMLGYGDRSKEGEPPTNDSFELYRSITANMSGNKEVTFEFAGHAFFLDPTFKGEGKGGGYLNRPFIEKGIENAVKRLQPV